MEQDIRQFLPLHPMEFRVLVTLADGTPSFLAQVLQDIERRRGSRRTPYPKELIQLVRGLIERGLLQSSSGPPEGDRRKDWFRISALGTKVLSAEARRLEGMVEEAREVGVLV